MNYFPGSICCQLVPFALTLVLKLKKVKVMPFPQASSGLWIMLLVHCSSFVEVVEAVCVRVLVAVLSVTITFLAKSFKNPRSHVFRNLLDVPLT